MFLNYLYVLFSSKKLGKEKEAHSYLHSVGFSLKGENGRSYKKETEERKK